MGLNYASSDDEAYVAHGGVGNEGFKVSLA